MSDYARHFKIFNAQPTDELVEKRTRNITDLGSAFRKKADVTSVLDLASDITAGFSAGRLASELREQVAKVIVKSSPAFVPDEHELEVLACGAMSAIQHLRTMKSATSSISLNDLFAAALFSGLSYQEPLAEPRLEALRQDLLSSAQNVVDERAENARVRLKVPDAGLSPEQLTAQDVNRVINDAVGALRANASMDREELDLLWWVLSDRSEVLQVRFSDRKDFATYIVGALELAEKTRHLPAQAHFQLALRHAQQHDAVDIGEVIASISEQKNAIKSKFLDGNEWPSKYPSILPLLGALLQEEVDSASSVANVKRSTADWIGRALLESCVARCASSL